MASPKLNEMTETEVDALVLAAFEERGSNFALLDVAKSMAALIPGIDLSEGLVPVLASLERLIDNRILGSYTTYYRHTY